MSIFNKFSKAKKMADGGPVEGDTLGSKINYPGADKKAKRGSAVEAIMQQKYAQGGVVEPEDSAMDEDDFESAMKEGSDSDVQDTDVEDASTSRMDKIRERMRARRGF